MAGKAKRGIRRVLMTGDTVGGVWTFTLELAEALGAKGIEVVLATLGGSPSKDQLSDAARIPNLCLLSSKFKLEWMDDPWDDVAASGRWLIDLERQYGPDLIHLNSFGHGALPWCAPVLLTAHSCVLSWWEAVKQEPAPAEWARYKAETARSLRGADVITVPSSAMAATLARHYGVDRSRCRVIANGRKASRFCRGDKQPFILSAGRIWDEAKNIRLLAGVAHDIPWPVYVAGDAGDTQLENCRMLGRLAAPEIADWYARASVYVLPARYEPFGLSALEAALSGCALVLGNIPTLREVWGDAAFFVSPDNGAELRRLLQKLIDYPAARAAAADRAYRRALTFEASRMSDNYLHAYRNIFAGRKAGPTAGKRAQCVS